MRITLDKQNLKLAIGAYASERVGKKIHLHEIEFFTDYRRMSTGVTVSFDVIPDPVVAELTLVDP